MSYFSGRRRWGFKRKHHSRLRNYFSKSMTNNVTLSESTINQILDLNFVDISYYD